MTLTPEEIAGRIDRRTALYRALAKGGKWTIAAMCDGRRLGIFDGSRWTTLGRQVRQHIERDRTNG